MNRHTYSAKIQLLAPIDFCLPKMVYFVLLGKVERQSA